MKKLYTYTLLVMMLVLSGHKIKAQVKPAINFEDISPKWLHVAVDSTKLEINIGKAMESFNFPDILYKDSIIYILYDAPIYWSFIEALSINNGKRLWKVNIDERNCDKEEYRSYQYINPEGNIELLSFKKKETIYHTFSRRVYNSLTGDLVEYTFGNPEDSTVQKMIWGTWRRNSYLFPLSDDHYQYLSSIKFNDLEASDTVSLFNYTVDKYGYGLSSKYIVYDRVYPYIGVGNIKLLNKDSIYVGHADYNTSNTDSDSFKLKIFSGIFDRDMNLITSNEVHGYDFPNKASYNFLYIDNKKFVKAFYWTKDSGERKTVYYINDYTGELINSFELKDDEGENLRKAYFMKLSGSEDILIISTTIHLKYGTKNYLYFHRLDKEGNLTKLKKIEIGRYHEYLKPRNAIELENGDIVLAAVHSYVKFDGQGNVKNWSAANYHNIICFSPESIGLKTGVEDVAKAPKFDMRLYPNPAGDELSIKLESEKDLKAMIHIYDESGREFYSHVYYGQMAHKVDVSSYPAGVYMVRLISEEGEILSAQKVIIR